VGSQAVLDHFHDTEEVCSHAIHLVDESDFRNLVSVCLMPHCFGLRLDSAHPTEDADRAVENSQGPFHLDGEIHMTGSVNNIDRVVAPIAGSDRRGDRDAPLLLLDHPVHGGLAVMDFSHLVHAPGVIEDPFGDRRLPCINVGNDTDVACLCEFGI
jgi:hypothetical protein